MSRQKKTMEIYRKDSLNLQINSPCGKISLREANSWLMICFGWTSNTKLLLLTLLNHSRRIVGSTTSIHAMAQAEARREHDHKPQHHYAGSWSPEFTDSEEVKVNFEADIPCVITLSQSGEGVLSHCSACLLRMSADGDWKETYKPPCNLWGW